MSEQQGTVSVFLLRVFSVALAQAGVDAPTLLAGLGLSPAVLEEIDTRLPASVAARAFEAAAERTGDPCFAIHAAERVPIGAVGFLDYHVKGTSYQDLVDGVRRDLALRCLPDTRISITEVAYLLGFSEPAAFHRAFKRWTSQTPAEYRRAHGGRTSLPPPPGAADTSSRRTWRPRSAIKPLPRPPRSARRVASASGISPAR